VRESGIDQYAAKAEEREGVKTRAAKVQREEMPYAVRFDVLARDEFTCQACGARPGNEGLHVDHLLPYSFGGSHDLLNLTTLCRRCNFGKGARVWLPPKMLLSQFDEQGFAVWKRFGSWNIEVTDNGVIANWPRDKGYTWIPVDRCWEPDWEWHFARKIPHRGCDDWCDEDPGYDDFTPARTPESIKLVTLSDVILSSELGREDAPNHSMSDLSHALGFMRSIFRRKGIAA